MKIVKNTNAKEITFGDLKEGDVFQSISNGYFYMKTSTKYDEYGDCFNTVHVESGSLHCSDNIMKVIPVDCELVIK